MSFLSALELSNSGRLGRWMSPQNFAQEPVTPIPPFCCNAFLVDLLFSNYIPNLTTLFSCLKYLLVTVPIFLTKHMDMKNMHTICEVIPHTQM